VLAFAVAGCGSNEVWVYFDNTGADEMVVTVDGQEGLTVAAGTFQVLKCPPGKKACKVECGGVLLFEGSKVLKPSDKWGACRKYVFNPYARNRYVAYTVKYGSSAFAGLLRAALQRPPEDRASELRAAYQELAKELQLLPVDEWTDAGTIPYVLESPPDQVRTKYSTTTRTALTRVSSQDYALLESARDRPDPSEQDLQALADVVERVLDAAP
jgi:hypothetical protein